MTLEELKALIASGEGETLELKGTTGQRVAACETLCALLNKDGGAVEGTEATEETEATKEAKGTKATEGIEGTSDKETAASLNSFLSLGSLSSLEGGAND